MTLRAPRASRSVARLEFLVLFVLFVMLTLFVAGCGGVAPYERGRLAHRTMSTGDLATPAEAHARAIQEGATGGGFEAGGGCGCN